MVFNAYLDPRVIGLAAASPPFALPTLIGILQGWLANVLVFDFEDERGRQAIGNAVREMPEGYERKLLSKLFSALATRNRILFVMEPDYMSADPDLEQAASNAKRWHLQVLLATAGPATPTEVECVGIGDYAGSRFEEARGTAAATGRVYLGGESDSSTFHETNFANALRYARRIDICDRLAGEKFGDSFEFTIRQLLTFLKATLSTPTSCEVVFHCGESQRNAHFCRQLQSFRGTAADSFRLKVRFYQAGPHGLPHERYIWTDQFGLGIGRGLDFLDRATGFNRDVTIDLKDKAHLEALIAGYAATFVREESL